MKGHDLTCFSIRGTRSRSAPDERDHQSPTTRSLIFLISQEAVVKVFTLVCRCFRELHALSVVSGTGLHTHLAALQPSPAHHLLYGAGEREK